MERLVRPALNAILDAIEGIEAATSGKDFAEYNASWLIRHGVQRGIEIISEATRRIPAELQATQPQIPWARIIAVGNVLRHEYHRVSDDIIWQIVVNDLPTLNTAIRLIASQLQEG
jgi:uncharacterized protein with HEPN domain